MDQARFHELCHQASHLAVIVEGRISNLVLTQANDGNEPIIREPEMRHAFCPTLESDGWRLPYGIEVPRSGGTDSSMRRGRTRRLLAMISSC
jgi:hypothetical protein